MMPDSIRIDIPMSHYCDAELKDKIEQFKYGIKSMDPDSLSEHINGYIYLEYCKDNLPIFERELRRRKLEKINSENVDS